MKKIYFADRKLIILQTLLFLGVAIAFGLLVIKDFSLPLAGGGDTEQWEYTGFYFAQNLKFSPFPQLNLINNQAFYPYGTNQVFQPWSVERDLVYATAYSIFGLGPWIQLYYFFSVLFTCVGTFFLLVKDYGFTRASGAGFILAFFSFYAIHKYPGHLSYSVFHWTAFSFITDFLILKRIAFQQRVSLKIILLRICLLFLCLGQELGYVAGFALTSFTISTLFIIGLLIYRYYKSKQKIANYIQSTFRSYNHELHFRPQILIALITVTIIAAYINLPLVIQISRAAKSFDFTGVPMGAWWMHPMRLFIPFFPGFNPSLDVFEKVLVDSPEGLGAGSPGWFLLIIAAIGLWQSRKQFAIFIPLIIIFLLCLFYHPTNFSTLKIFPWFAFNRVSGRSTVIYPIIFCLFALHINFSTWRLRTRQILTTLLIVLACTEIFVAYSLKSNYQPYAFDKNFFTYMNYVKAQPGEAVLDWPFCVIGGNGVGGEKLCPFFSKTATVFSLRRFHEKKVLGQYYGRIHPSQLEPYLTAGWDKLFIPDNQDILKATQQKRCFRPDEWQFLEDFYTLNDFAGINLYTDLLPESCVIDFYARFGTPQIETSIPWAGLVKFIPKTSKFSNQVNLALGTSLKFEPVFNVSSVDLLEVNNPNILTVTGISVIEEDAQSNTWRWGTGSETQLTFKLPQNQTLVLNFTFTSPIGNQDVIVTVNEKIVAQFRDIKLNESITQRLKFEGTNGFNNIAFKYKDWNHNQTTFAASDDRKMAISFSKLAVGSE